METQSPTLPSTTTISDLIHITPIPKKGLGILALSPIAPGTILLQESTLMHIPIPARNLTEAHLSTAFSHLSPSDQAAVSSLSINATGQGSQLHKIYTSNTFGNGEACWLHPTISRVNHSCSPNATTVSDPCCIGDACQIIADREIATGEEVTFSYNNELYEITTSAQRAILLQKQYGFQCDCIACTPGTFQELSDIRRSLIKELRKRLHGLQTSDFEDLSINKIWMKEESLSIPPSSEERMVWNSLLAGLRRAEGLSAFAVAQNYWHAAEALLEQIQAMESIVVLSMVERVQAMMEKAIRMLDTVRSPFDHDPQTLREAWKGMQAKPCMRVAMGFMDGSLEVNVKGSAGSSAFALEISDGTLAVLSKTECNARLNGIIGSISPVSQDDDSNLDPGDRDPSTLKTACNRISGAPKMVKVVGAAITCAAPVAAYLMMR